MSGQNDKHNYNLFAQELKDNYLGDVRFRLELVSTSSFGKRQKQVELTKVWKNSRIK